MQSIPAAPCQPDLTASVLGIPMHHADLSQENQHIGISSRRQLTAGAKRRAKPRSNHYKQTNTRLFTGRRKRIIWPVRSWVLV